MVEHNLAKVGVAGSSPVTRFRRLLGCGHFLIHRRHSQVVRQRSAKPPSPVQIRVPPLTPSAFPPNPNSCPCALSPGWWNGRHNGLKIRWTLRPCRFESGPRHVDSYRSPVVLPPCSIPIRPAEHLSRRPPRPIDPIAVRSRTIDTLRQNSHRPWLPGRQGRPRPAATTPGSAASGPGRPRRPSRRI